MTFAELVAKMTLKADKPSFSAADKLLENVKRALIGIVAFKTIKWFGSLIDDTAELAGRLVETSEKTGVLIETLQELEFAGKLSGLGAEGLSTGLKFLAKNMDGAIHGSKESKKLFKEMGIAVEDASGHVRNTDEVLGDIAEVFSKIPNGALKSAGAMKIFGRSGVEMIPFLNEGRSGISKLREEFKELGGGLSGDDARSLEEWGDKVDKVKTAAAAFRNTLVSALIPTLQRVADKSIEWIKANRELIASKIRGWVVSMVGFFHKLWPVLVRIAGISRKVGEILLRVFKLVWPVAEKVGTIIGKVTEKIVSLLENSENLSLVLTTLATTFLVVKGVAIATAVASAAAGVAAAAPFVALIAIIAGVNWAIRDLWKWVNGGESTLKKLDQWLTRTFDESIAWWKQQFAEFFQWVIDGIKQIPHNIKEALKDVIGFGDGPNKFLDRARAISPRGEGGAPVVAGSVARTPLVAGGGAVEVQAPQFSAQIHVHTSPGANAGGIGTEVRKAVQSLWDSNMRRAGATTRGR